MIKKIASFLLLGTLAFSSIGMSFASKPTKIDYSKDLINGLGFEIKSAEEAYKRETTEDEDIIYTAFQLGLLKGVSWDFENPMSEEERETILANAMEVYETKQEKNVDSNNDVTNKEQITSSPELSYETDFGEIKKPSNVKPNAQMWTDEEFHKWLTVDRDKLNPVYHVYQKSEFLEWQGMHCYYDDELRTFMFRGEFLGKNEEGKGSWLYYDINTKTDGRGYDILKAVIYNAYVNTMTLEIKDDVDRIWIDINAQDTGSDNIDFFITLDTKNHGFIYGQIEGYDSTETPVMTEWFINCLYDMSYKRSLVDNYFDLSTKERQELVRSFGFSEQKYNDVIYGICDALYGVDAESIYLNMLKDHTHSIDHLMKTDKGTYKMEQLKMENSTLFIYDPVRYPTIYGIWSK